MLEQSTNHGRLRSIILAALLIMSAVATPVAASHDDDGGFMNGFTDDSGNEGILDRASSYASYATGLYERVSHWSASQNPFTDSDQPTAASEAGDVQEYFNQNNESFIAYANNRSAGGTDYDVWELTFEQDGESETVYLVSDYNSTSGEYETAEIVNGTDRTVDESITLSGYAAVNAREELKSFHKEFVTEDKPVTSSYERKLAGKYFGHVESSILDGDA